ncbi:serine protease [Agarivorans sp. TSD2052]|uniref:S1 family peptidase n=1 Tax=Agarivorans sp. TSD2052 TaxID=2937286 RepID=UPI00200F62A9|nr:serine protease [Agarivorans sp. TSD2052]UPW19569.1 serine protease [Agarivorans sp. TSD2052]
MLTGLGRVLAVTALLVPSGLSLASTERVVPYVVGGEDASQGEYPWMTQLKAGSSYCGAVLINEQWVLSAAHCTFDQYFAGHHVQPSAIKLKIGDDVFSYLDNDGERVSEVCQHPDYVDFSDNHVDRVTGDNDLVLLRLTQASSVTPISFNQKAVFDDYSPGFGMRVIGFGRVNNDPDNPEYLDTLQQADLFLTAQAACEDVYGSDLLSAQMFCADSPVADSCSGDSGGPLLIDEGSQYKLAGIVSWGTSSCAGAPGVYADVGQLAPWINQVINANAEERLDANLCSQREAIARPESAGGALGGIGLIALLLLGRVRRS